ncbi:MAG: GMC family oxidoreductase [bacterium]|nr:GMC family oxidoreductase [bacterium]
MIVVVGSGPAGVMCAAALRRRGCEVTLLDGGLDLEPERRQRLDRLRRTDPETWPDDWLQEIREATVAKAGGVPLKLVSGSDYPYRDVERLTPFSNRRCSSRPTLARGGFSSIWGAAVMPYASRDIEDHWPLRVADLEPHYRSVFERAPLSAVEDDLAAGFPLYSESHPPLESSATADAMLRSLDGARGELRRRGVTHGRSRLAVRAQDDDSGPGCIYCGMCLHGCPHELIYNSATTLDELRRDGLQYGGDRVVRRVEEHDDAVTLHCVSRADGVTSRIDAERVYIAAGVLGTTRILLESLNAFDRTLPMLDSQYWLLPLLRRAADGDPSHEALHTLAQLFLEIDDPAVSGRTVHLQLYTYNDLYRRAVRSTFGPLGGLAQRLGAGLLRRLVLVQGYLHSEESPRIDVTLRRGNAGASSTLELRQVDNPTTRPTLRRVVKRLHELRRAIGASPVRPLLRVAPAGRGFHSGGTFPMRETPGPFQSDLLGRPHGLSRVHAVDATVFPSVPATTITLSVMANAHRIGSTPVED